MKKITALTAALMLAVSMAAQVNAAPDYSGLSRDQLKTEEARLTEDLTELRSWLYYGMSSADYAALEEEVQTYTGWTSRILMIPTAPSRYVMEITSDADAYTRFRPYALDGTPYNSLVAHLGAYHGVVYEPSQEPIMLEIVASGTWEVKVIPLDMMMRIGKGDTISGVGEAALIVDPSAEAPISVAVTATPKADEYVSVGLTVYDSAGSKLGFVAMPANAQETTALLDDAASLLHVYSLRPDTSWSITLQ